MPNTNSQPQAQRLGVQSTTTTQPSFSIEDYISGKVNVTDGVSLSEVFWVIVILIISGKAASIVKAFIAASKASATFVFVSKEEVVLKQTIMEYCNRILQETGADRIDIGLFHNGTQNQLKVHEKKLSVMFEATGRLKPIKDQTQAIPIERIAEELAICETHWVSVKRGEKGTRCDAYLDRVDSIRKDFKFLSTEGNKNFGLINLFYLEMPLDDHMDDKSTAMRVENLTNKLEYALLLYLKPNKSLFLKAKRRVQAFLGQVDKD